MNVCCSDPLSKEAPQVPFCQAIQPGRLPLPSKVAWSPDLGIAPVDGQVVSICERAAVWFASMGAHLVHDCPNLHDAAHIFQVWLPAYLVFKCWAGQGFCVGWGATRSVRGQRGGGGAGSVNRQVFCVCV